MVNPFEQINMSSIFGSELDGSTNSILCFYINPTSQIQNVRITNIPSYYWERIVFPGQQLMFTAVTSAILEIHTSDTTIAGSQQIPCHDLHIDENSIKSLSLVAS